MVPHSPLFVGKLSDCLPPCSNVSSVRLSLHSFFTECQWDYLYIFDGDSIFATKLAAFT